MTQKKPRDFSLSDISSSQVGNCKPAQLPSMWAHLFLIDAVAAEPPTSPHPLPPRDNPHATAHREPDETELAEGEKNLRPVRLASVLAYLYTPLTPSIP